MKRCFPLIHYICHATLHSCYTCHATLNWRYIHHSTLHPLHSFCYICSATFTTLGVEPIQNLHQTCSVLKLAAPAIIPALVPPADPLASQPLSPSLIKPERIWRSKATCAEHWEAICHLCQTCSICELVAPVISPALPPPTNPLDYQRLYFSEQARTHTEEQSGVR